MGLLIHSCKPTSEEINLGAYADKKISPREVASPTSSKCVDHDDDLFATGVGLSNNPFGICTANQLSNISLAVYDENARYLLNFPYMHKNFILLSNITYEKEAFFTLGSYKGAIDYSCDKGYILPEDCLNLVELFSLVTSGGSPTIMDEVMPEAFLRARENLISDIESSLNVFSKPFTGSSFDGNGYFIDAGGDFTPHDTKYAGFFGASGA